MGNKKLVKDKFRRVCWANIELNYLIIKLFLKSLNKKIKLLFKLWFWKNLPNQIYKTKIRNYCRVTGRSRSIIRYFKISRLVLRRLACQNLFFGLKKSSW